MKPLQLSANIKSIIGVSREAPRVIQLTDFHRSKPKDRHHAALIDSNEDFIVAINSGWTLLVCKDQVSSLYEADHSQCSIFLDASANYLKAGDVISLNLEKRRFRTLFRIESKHNSFLVTERCNHLCLMCSQPPKDHDDSWLLDEIEECLPLLPTSVESIGFTGGEPLTDSVRFIALLEKARHHLPKTRLHVLSNGRYFAENSVTAAWSNLNDKNLCVGIPIYSCVDHVHDHIVQSKGALDETIMGILRLKDRAQKVEIRLVLHALTVPTVVETCRWIARSLPFVDHVALMGLENTGYAIANTGTLWIDPVDYSDDLSRAVEELASARVPVSIYNLPKCVLPKKCWPYAMMSISDWKNSFLPQCSECTERSKCSGFFSTGRPRFSRGVTPFLTATGT